MSIKVTHYAAELQKAERCNVKLAPITKRNKKLTLEDAYSIQLEIAANKITNGSDVIGKKIGHVHLPNRSATYSREKLYVGYLFDDMVVSSELPVTIAAKENMQIGMSLAFKLRNDIKGPLATYVDVLMATDYVIPVIEIFNSHWNDRDIATIDVVAENGAITNVIFGNDKLTIDEVNLRTTGLTVYKNEQLVLATAYAFSHGHPAHAIALCANKLVNNDVTFKSGQYVLTSYAQMFIDVQKSDHIHVDFGLLGQLAVTFS